MASNGRLPQSQLGRITNAANGQAAWLRKDAAKAFMAMNTESERRYGVTLRSTSGRTAYRTYADQEYFWDLYLHHGGALAARPGTSNHGWGLAVDFATRQMRWIVDQIGAKYGFAKRWSDAQSEWWHILFSPSHVTANLNTERTLRLGSHGNDVKELQKDLRAVGRWGTKHGYRGHDRKVGTVFGLPTRAALRGYQKSQKLKQDGIYGPNTRRHLEADAKRARARD